MVVNRRIRIVGGVPRAGTVATAPVRKRKDLVVTEQLVFTTSVWDDIKNTEASIAVGDMERLEALAEIGDGNLSFPVELWETVKATSADIAVGDMERLERYGNRTASIPA